MANTIKSRICLSVWVILLGLGSVRAAERSSGWKAGVARVDTTPTKPVRMAGYASRTSPSQGVAHPLAAKALVLADSSDQRSSFVTCDIIAFRRALPTAWPSGSRPSMDCRARMWSCSRRTITPAPPRSSPGPVTARGEQSATRGLREQRCLHDRPGKQDRRPDRRGARTNGAGEPVLWDRPRPLCVEPARADRATGSSWARTPPAPPTRACRSFRSRTRVANRWPIVFGYACHNTTLRPDMMKIAADFAGYAQDRIEADNPGAVAMFVTGCAGDADPHPFGTLEMAKDHGEELGEAVKFVLDHPAWMTNLTGPLRTAFTETTIHFAGPTDRASYVSCLNDPELRPKGPRQTHDRVPRPRAAHPNGISLLLCACHRPG